MKFVSSAGFRHWFLSLPVWEEWIEISMPRHDRRGKVSLPVWEEWIEIGIGLRRTRCQRMSLPVWEEWIEISGTGEIASVIHVSSRMGRVD